MNGNFEQTLIDQNPHWKAIHYAHALKRQSDTIAMNNLKLEEIQVISGIRRCGKSTLLQTLINHLMEHIDPKTLLYINFDDPSYIDVYQNVKLIQDIIITAEKLTQQPIQYLFLDEIQNITLWEKYIKSAYDSKRFKKIVVTGSNGDLLNSDYTTLLSGRYIETQLYPLSFHEILANHNIDSILECISQKPLVLSLLDTMLHFGGFPRVILLEDEKQRQQILKNYYETIVLKDCIANHDIRDSKKLFILTHYLLNNISSLYSYNSLSKVIESNENTTQQLIHILQSAFFVDEIKQFAYSLKTQTRSKKKLYCIDNGLITATTFKFSHNYGKLLENLVFTELRKRTHDNLFFFNDQKECDFIVHQQNNMEAIQVCYELNDNNKTREINGLKEAMKKFDISKGFIITYNQEEKISQHISVIPFWKFFMEPENLNK